MKSVKSKHGGARPGAGRPRGSGKFKEPTRAIRVPASSIRYIEDFLNDYPMSKKIAAGVSDNAGRLNIPLFSSQVAAGRPSPAEDHVDATLDMNEYMVQRPESTFMLRVEGESMKDAGILPNDILVVDRSLQARHNKIVIAALDGELTVKRLFHRGDVIKLLPENPAFAEIEINNEDELVIWGVVVGSFRRFRSF